LEKIKGKHENFEFKKHGRFEFLLFIGTHTLKGKIDKSKRRPSERMIAKKNSLDNGLLRG